MSEPSATSLRVAICMGSQSDWSTMEESAKILEMLDVSFEAKIVSAHRTPDRLASFCWHAGDRGSRGPKCGADGSADIGTR